MARALAGGVWKKDSVKDVAESLGISNLSDEVATALAGEVEYRLWELIQESLKFAHHSHRARLLVSDVSYALKAKNQEPLWGFSSPGSILPFKKIHTPTGIVYALEEQDIDLSRPVRVAVPPTGRRDVSYSAHWLAIEGVQPLVKENPTPAEIAKYTPAPKPALSLPHPTNPSATVTPLVKHVLSRELQLYFTRLTDSLLPAAPADQKQAAVTSLREDSGLHMLVPYLVSWGAEQVANHLDDLVALQWVLEMDQALMDNTTLFLEPYLHQLVPPILTCLLTSALPVQPTQDGIAPVTIRTNASALLATLLARYSAAYPSLKPRILKTLLRGLGAPARGLSARWGAARGLAELLQGAAGQGGNRAVREWVGGGLRRTGELLEGEEETESGEREEVVQEVLNVLQASLPPFAEEDPMDLTAESVVGAFGQLFGQALVQRWDAGGREIAEALIGIHQLVEDDGMAEDDESDDDVQLVE